RPGINEGREVPKHAHRPKETSHPHCRSAQLPVPPLPLTRPPQRAAPGPAKANPMNTYLVDAGIVTALIVGHVAGFLVGAVVLTRIALAAHARFNRNDR